MSAGEPTVEILPPGRNWASSVSRQRTVSDPPGAAPPVRPPARLILAAYPGAAVVLSYKIPTYKWSVPAFLDTRLGCQLTELPIS